MSKPVCLLFLLFACSATIGAQGGQSKCVLSSFMNGQVVTVHGRVVHGPHDMMLVIPNCDTVVLAYADDPNFSATASSTGVNLPPGTPVNNDSKLELRKDSEFRRFQSYVGATNKGGGKNLCMECYMYEVEANFTGRLDVSEKVGLIRDEEEKKIVGMDGFGHPVPFTRYRLIIESVSGVVARKQPQYAPSSSSR
jgi:hypothetical protein